MTTDGTPTVWSLIPLEVRLAIQDALTAKQLRIWSLKLEHDYGIARIATIQHCSRANIREQLAAADRRLFSAGVRQDADGRWHLEDPTDEEAA